MEEVEVEVEMVETDMDNGEMDKDIGETDNLDKVEDKGNMEMDMDMDNVEIVLLDDDNFSNLCS